MKLLFITFTVLFFVTLSHCEEESEFFKCISCHKEDKPKEEYGACLKELDEPAQKIYKRCCMSWYDTDFCNNAVLGKINFDAFCKETANAAQISACFEFNMTKDTNETKAFASSSNILNFEAYSKCKESVKTRYCKKDIDASGQHFSGIFSPIIHRFFKSKLMLTSFQKDKDDLKAGWGRKKRASKEFREFPKRMPKPVYCNLEVRTKKGGENSQ